LLELEKPDTCKDENVLLVICEAQVVDNIVRPLYLYAADLIEVPRGKYAAYPLVVGYQALLCLEIVLYGLTEGPVATPR
jgi:hypothetical protein